MLLLQLQGDAKKLRRARRAALLGVGDPYLRCLYAEAETTLHQTTNALTEVVSAHSALQQALQSGLLTDVWGVMQHAVNLLQQQVSPGCT